MNLPPPPPNEIVIKARREITQVCVTNKLVTIDALSILLQLYLELCFKCGIPKQKILETIDKGYDATAASLES